MLTVKGGRGQRKRAGEDVEEVRIWRRGIEGGAEEEEEEKEVIMNNH